MTHAWWVLRSMMRSQRWAPSVEAEESLEPPPVQPGDKVGKYEVIEVLGEGGMGVVARARDEQLQREVALKLIQPSLVSSDTFRERFLVEARSMARVSHPNVVHIFDFGEHGEAPYFVMELFEGVDLDTWIDSRGEMSIDEGLGILRQVCMAVEAIHEAGTVHRDLKPENVLIGAGGKVAVTDFGLSVRAEQGLQRWLMGTPGFVAPEVLMNIEGMPPEQVDAFALGAMAYEVLSGFPAFPGGTREEVLESQRTTELPEPPSVHRPELSTAFDRPILAALARDANARSTVAELRRGLGDARRAAARASVGSRIIVADPDIGDRGMVSVILSAAFPDAEVHPVGSGREALHALGGGPTSLLVLDLELENVPAAQLVRVLRGSARFENVPVVLVSNHGGGAEWGELRALGADGFLLKPIDDVPLVALARSLVADPTRRRRGN